MESKASKVTELQVQGSNEAVVEVSVYWVSARRRESKTLT